MVIAFLAAAILAFSATWRLLGIGESVNDRDAQPAAIDAAILIVNVGILAWFSVELT